MKCSGRSAVSDEPIEIAFESAIQNVDPVLDDPGDSETFLAPGFIDLQVNGGGDVLFNDAPTAETIRTIAAAHRKFGTTGFLVTLITDAPEKTELAIAAVKPGNSVSFPNTEVRPRMKMVGASTPGMAAPGTRITSLVALRISAQTVAAFARSPVSCCAPGRGARR